MPRYLSLLKILTGRVAKVAKDFVALLLGVVPATVEIQWRLQSPPRPGSTQRPAFQYAPGGTGSEDGAQLLRRRGAEIRKSAPTVPVIGGKPGEGLEVDTQVRAAPLPHR